MKKIIGILMALMMCLTLTSCVTTATAQVDDMYDDVDISVVVTYGTPYYNAEGLILYYFYQNMYYYPYYYHNRYYFHRYHYPLPQDRMWRYRPVPRDFYNHHRPHHTHPHNHVTHPNRGGHHNHKPNGGGTHTRPNTHRNDMMHYGGPRPNIRPNQNNTSRGGIRHTPPRSSTRHGNFGGRR